MKKEVEEKIFNILRKKHLKKIRKRIKNQNFSIICNNCVGGFIYHDLGMKFLSPTINLFMKSDDFVIFAKDIKYYCSCEVIQVKDETKNFPVGKLLAKDKEHKDIEIYFNHYDNFESAKNKWEERAKRINYNNIYIILEFYDNAYSESILEDFQAIPYENKIILTHKKYNNVKNTFAVTCYKDNKPNAQLFKYKGISGKRYLDEFDYVKFLNQKSKIQKHKFIKNISKNKVV